MKSVAFSFHLASQAIRHASCESVMEIREKSISFGCVVFLPKAYVLHS